MQVETSTNIKESWLIRLHYQTRIISVSFFHIQNSTFISHFSVTWNMNEVVHLPFPLWFCNPRSFSVTGFSNKRTCQLFFQAFHMKHFNFSGIRITNKILFVNATGNTKIFMYLYLYMYLWKKNLIVQTSTETKTGVFLVQNKNQHFQVFGTDTHLSEHGRTFSG